MEISKLNQLKRYMTSFESECRKFERNPQRLKINNIFPFTMEEFFEKL